MKKFVLILFCLTTGLIIFPSIILAENTSTPATRGQVIRNTKAAVAKVKKTVAHIIGAQITGISGKTLTVSKDGKTINVTTDSKTRFRRLYFGKSDLSEFSVGNVLNIWGIYSDEAQTAITASMIRNMSIMKRHGTFIGDIKSKTADNFVITSLNRGDIIVYFDANTRFVNRSMLRMKYDDIKVGDRVRAKGLWDKSTNTITAVAQVKDFSQPLKPTKAPTPTK